MRDDQDSCECYSAGTLMWLIKHSYWQATVLPPDHKCCSILHPSEYLEQMRIMRSQWLTLDCLYTTAQRYSCQSFSMPMAAASLQSFLRHSRLARQMQCTSITLRQLESNFWMSDICIRSSSMAMNRFGLNYLKVLEINFGIDTRSLTYHL